MGDPETQARAYDRAPDERLYPTKTRLALLGAVAHRDVIDGSIGSEETEGEVFLLDPCDETEPTKVTARVVEAERAGWVEEGHAYYRLTAEGERVLREYGGAP